KTFKFHGIPQDTEIYLFYKGLKNIRKLYTKINCQKLALDETFLRVTFLRTACRMSLSQGSPRKKMPRNGCGTRCGE
ncbi:MAG: hypothetical protein LPK02_16590, partial [Rhodobacterales bacterium]|nr:hypothetical protein [Rhodobacterales bacterium]